MCGIAGIFDLREQVDQSILEKALSCMAHRGPDGQGLFLDTSVGLAHRRLSIIDLAGGSQPMFNEDRSLVVVFNGEIYNFPELRHELESKGHCFRTSSDTEVILHGYEEWGKTGCVEKLEGMFAFALFDRKDSSLLLARDRCGEKPLYYFQNEGRFLFASEIQTLLSMIGHAPTPDPKAIYLFLRLGYIPAPYCFFSDIRKMQAGSCLLLQGGEQKAWRYYQPGIGRKERASEAELCEELEDTLRRAVKRMLVSDVPIGAFLSGGLDSSLISALMAKEGSTPRTFSISFGEGAYDESKFARLASQAIGTQHVQYRVSFGDLEECLSIMDGFGEPYADPSAIPTYYLARETRRHVTVALSGDGGDELFGGYRRYIAQRFVPFYKAVPDRVRGAIIERLLSLRPEKDAYYADSLLKSARIFTERCESLDTMSDLMLNVVFSHEEIASLFPELPDERDAVVDRLRATASNDPVERLMHADRLLYLPDDILVKVDRMSMRNSLEVRSPFLDPQMLDLSERIPLSLKIRGMSQKCLLKKVALRYLPREIVHRKKHGFMPPMAQWIRDSGRDELLRRMPAGMKAGAADRFLEDHFSGKVDHSDKIFALIVLGRYSLQGR